MGLQQRLVEAFCCPSPLPVSTLVLPGLLRSMTRSCPGGW